MPRPIIYTFFYILSLNQFATLSEVGSSDVLPAGAGAVHAAGSPIPLPAPHRPVLPHKPDAAARPDCGDRL